MAQECIVFTNESLSRIKICSLAWALVIVVSACGGGSSAPTSVGQTQTPDTNNPNVGINPPPDTGIPPVINNPQPDTRNPPDVANPPPGDPTAAIGGFYKGSQGTETFDTVIVDTGHFYLVATDPVGQKLTLFYGRGAANGAAFTSPGIRRFDVQPTLVFPQASQLVSTIANDSLTGTLTLTQSAGTSPARFSGAADPAYKTPPTLSAVQGSFLGDAALAGINFASDVHAETLRLNVAVDGTLTGSSRGCSHSGKLTPHASGGNLYNATLNFRYGNGCSNGITLTGHSTTKFIDVNGVATPSLSYVVANTDFSKVLFYVAVKQP
jgi:hypothetical protein